MKFVVRLESDDRMKDVQQAILKRDPYAEFDPEKNPVTFWVTTKLNLQAIRDLDGVKDAVVSCDQ